VVQLTKESSDISVNWNRNRNRIKTTALRSAKAQATIKKNWWPNTAPHWMKTLRWQCDSCNVRNYMPDRDAVGKNLLT